MWFPILCAIFGGATKYYFLKYLRQEKRGEKIGKSLHGDGAVKKVAQCGINKVKVSP